jgi:hypothetical protein
MYVKPVATSQLQLQIHNYCLTGQETQNTFVGKVGHFESPRSSSIYYTHVRTVI